MMFIIGLNNFACIVNVFIMLVCDITLCKYEYLFEYCNKVQTC